MNRFVASVGVAAGLFVGTAAASEGTVTGWLRPCGLPRVAWLKNAAGETRAAFGIYMYDWARADIHCRGQEKTTDFRRNVSDLRLRQDEWVHIAFVWSGETARFYVNGAVYGTTSTWGDRTPKLKDDLLGDGERFELDAHYARDFKVVHETMSAKDIVAEYRARCPVDVVIDDAIVSADEPGAPTYLLAPGNHFMRPKVAPDIVENPATVEVATRVFRVGADGKTLEPVAGTETDFVRRDVRAPVRVRLADRTYAEGRYCLKLRIRRPGADEPFVRTLPFRAIRPTPLAPTATKEPWQKVETFFDKTYRASGDVRWASGGARPCTGAAGAYIEAGAASGNRFADIVDIPESAIGKPCLLEIDWPDDKPRAMGLYMYEIQPASCRDHLQGGLATGVEILNTGRSLTRAYLYFPVDTNALFEARTLITGRPAAISRLRLSRLAEPLPVLKVRRPKNCRGRTFGHTDEDQTFNNNLSGAKGVKILDASMEVTLDGLVKYLAYTGQNAFHYSTLRYLYDYGPMDGCTQLGMWPLEQGTWKGVVRELGRAGASFVSQQAMSQAPTFGHVTLLEGDYEARGLALPGWAGSCASLGERTGDVGRQDVRDILCADLVPTLADLAESGAAGTTIYLANKIARPTTYPAAEFGEQDPVRRAANVTAATRGLVEALRARVPGHPVNVEVAGDEEEYRAHGVDAAAIAKIPGVRLLNQRQNTMYYFNLFTGKSVGETDELDRLYDPAAPALTRLAALSEGGSLPAVYTQPVYFETFVSPLGDDKRFQNYFQDADLKPHGRWFLREPAYCLAKCDMLDYAIGMLPLGSLGNEEETREFCQAYCALPAKPFKTMKGTDDPVVGRYLETDEGTYFYVVNYSLFPVTAVLDRTVRATDLSTETAADVRRIALKPFELRSFLAEAKGLSPSVSVADIPADAFKDRLAETEKAFAALDREGLAHAKASASVAKARAALAEGRLAAAHYWLFTCPVNAAMEQYAQFDLIVAEAQMHRKGRWAVNCGCSAFSTDGGRIFSPDRKWDGETYGWYGDRRKTVSRDNERVAKDSPLKEVFATESYDIEGYRFKLPKGRYHVTAHVKWGHQRSWADSGIFKLRYEANGIPLGGGDVDLYASQGGDFSRPSAFSAEVDVTDVIDLAVKYVGSDKDGDTIRVLNAIEIEACPADTKGN